MDSITNYMKYLQQNNTKLLDKSNSIMLTRSLRIKADVSLYNSTSHKEIYHVLENKFINPLNNILHLQFFKMLYYKL